MATKLYSINGRPCRNEREFRDVQKKMEDPVLGRWTHLYFKDTKVTAEELDRYFDFNGDGKTDFVHDVSALSAAQRTYVFDKLPRVLEKYGYRLLDRLQDRAQIIKYVVEGKMAIPEIWKKDKKFVLEVVGQNGLALRWADPSLACDPKVQKAAVRQNPAASQYCISSVKED